MNFEQARFNMIEQQILPCQVLEPAVTAQLFAIKRELFVPAVYRNLAFADTQIPLGYGQCMLSPSVEARMFNALRLKASDRVLEIGTGSGYMAALLATQAQQVDTIEVVPELAAMAQDNLKKAKVTNVTVSVGNGLDSAMIHGAYDVIVLSGSVPLLPQYLTAHLRAGGRMIAIVGADVGMSVQLVVRESDTVCVASPLFETMAPALKNGQSATTFTL